MPWSMQSILEVPCGADAASPSAVHGQLGQWLQPEPGCMPASLSLHVQPSAHRMPVAALTEARPVACSSAKYTSTQDTGDAVGASRQPELLCWNEGRASVLPSSLLSKAKSILKYGAGWQNKGKFTSCSVLRVAIPQKNKASDHRLLHCSISVLTAGHCNLDRPGLQCQ